MIITRTPFRISFGGGGTDLRDFYKRAPGAVTSSTINKYMYIIVNKRFNDTIRVSYSKTEIVSSVDEIQHPIVREALKLVGITTEIEIVSIADIPAGSGLGSSSSFSVGLLNALYAYKGILKSAEELARDACKIEIDILGEPIGKQDQYIVAYGGLRHIQFNPDGGVFVEIVMCSKEYKEELSRNLLLLHTGISRGASSILREQKDNIKQVQNREILSKMRDLALEIRHCLANNSPLDTFGRLLHEGWMLKKQLASSISNHKLDEYYEKALRAGALGGKVTGAGGGGFLLLYCPHQHQQRVLEALHPLSAVKFSFEPEGSKIIYIT